MIHWFTDTWWCCVRWGSSVSMMDIETTSSTILGMERRIVNPFGLEINQLNIFFILINSKTNFSTLEGDFINIISCHMAKSSIFLLYYSKLHDKKKKKDNEKKLKKIKTWVWLKITNKTGVFLKFCQQGGLFVKANMKI